MHRRALLCVLAAVGGVLVAGGTGTAAATEHVTVTGRVQVLGAMGGFGGHRTVTTLATTGRDWQLRLPAGVTPPSGSVVRISGTVSRSVLTADKVEPVRAAPAVATTGTQQVYVIRVQWAGNPSDGTTTGDVSTAFAQAGQWFDEVSYGLLPGFAVTQDPTYETIADPGGCGVSHDTDTIYDAAVAAAGIQPADYDHVVVYYAAAGSGCSFAGLGTIAGRGLWLNGDLTQRVVTHELGHNLGLDHSHSLSCVTTGTSTQTTISDDCASPDEYGDPADTMGSEGVDLAGHYTAAQKARLGWLGAAAQSVAPCASVSLNPFETLPGSGIVAARVDAGADPSTFQPVSYWFEYRHPTGGVDALPPTGPLPSGLTDGVLLHLTRPDVSFGYPDNGPYLLDGTAQDGAFDFSDAAVPASTSVTTPQGYTFAVGSVGSTAALTLSTSRPSVPRAPTAVRDGSGVRVSWQEPACVGTGASAISSYQVGRIGSSSTTTSSTSAVVPGLPGVAGAEFLVNATNDAAATGAAAVVPTSAPTITGRDLTTYINGGLFDFTPSVSNGGREIIFYVAHGEPVGGAPPIDDSWYDVTSGEPPQVFLEMAKGDTYRVTVAPLFSDFTFGPASAAVRTTMVDVAAPSASITAPKKSSTPKASTAVRWSGSDSGGSGLSSYDVRYRVAPYDKGFGSYVSPSAWQHTTQTSASLDLVPGSTYCFSVRARDGNGNTSKYGNERCTSRPLDDGDLTADSRWDHLSGSEFYAGTASRATARGAVLNRSHVHARHLAILATVCPDCGKVGVYVGRKRVATVDLQAASERASKVVAVKGAGTVSGDTVRLKVLTSGKPVTIDGLVVRAV
jgi:hypothetical protein